MSNNEPFADRAGRWYDCARGNHYKCKSDSTGRAFCMCECHPHSRTLRTLQAVTAHRDKYKALCWAEAWAIVFLLIGISSIAR